MTMPVTNKHLKIWYVVAAMITTYGNFFAQNSPAFRNTSLDIVTDMASIALGESFVANRNSSSSFFENPSALPDDRETRLFFDYRSQAWSPITDNMKYFSFGITNSNSLGNFGFSYNQYTSGDIVTTAEPIKQTTNDNNRTFILSYSNNLFENLRLGFSAKLFNRSLTSAGMNYSVTSNDAFLFDLGILYGRKGFFNSSSTRDNISFGMSFQNFGTKFTIESTTLLLTEKENVRLPRYLRLGFAYELNTVPSRSSGATLDFLLTGEYKSLLNPAEQEKDDVDYWSAGIEAMLFKIISLRLGGVSSPEYNILFDRAKFNLRYGIGLNFPLAVLGLGYPLYIKFDYASIPINHISIEGAKNSLYAFGVSLVYNSKM